MNKELIIALCFSIAVHLTVLATVPHARLTEPGQKDRAQELAVLGIIKIPVAAKIEKPSPPPVKPKKKAPEKKKEPVPIEPKPVSPPEKEPVVVEKKAKKEQEKANKETKVAKVEKKHKKKHSNNKAPAPPVKKSPGKAHVRKGEIQDVRSAYLQHVLREIEQAKHYPANAYRRGIEGTVEVIFEIQQDGQISEMIRCENNTQENLVHAAREIIRNAAPFKPIPIELQLGNIQIKVPIKFQLDDRQARNH